MPHPTQPMDRDKPVRFAFGPFDLDLDAWELRRDGRPAGFRERSWSFLEPWYKTQAGWSLVRS